MAAERKYIDIDDKPEFIDLVDVIRESHGPVSWRLAGVEVAIIAAPPAKHNNESPDAPVQSRNEELMKLAGAWAEMDTDSLVEQIYERRANSVRRSVTW